MKIAKEKILTYLLIIVTVSTTLCFLIKFLGYKQVIPWNIGYNDVMPWAKKAFEPGKPYLEKAVEYPIIIGVIMYIASRFNLNFYIFFHYFLFLTCAIISTIYLFKLSNIMNSKKKYLFLFWAIAPSLLWFVYFNWDIIAVMFSILALYYYKKDKDIIATIFLSLGFSTKIYPILILFPLLLHRKLKDWVKIGIIFTLTFLILNGYFIIKKFGVWYLTFQFHSTREPNIDSIWFILQKIVPSKFINLLTLIIFAVLYLYLNIKHRKKDFIFLSLISILLFLITNKVFSPQYLLWLLPFFAIYGINLLLFLALEFSNLSVLFATLSHIFSHQAFTIALVFSGFFVVLRHMLLILILVRITKLKS